MSWQLVSFALVLLSLALAFWWYERSRPPAKLIAVVATLAAIAALGRDAFVALPDVKPITAIVLISGVAFGAGPGFAVGAIAALTSNILLGEGPWTPWQMLGWGLVGLIGAGLGRLSSRRLPPLALALACAVSAEVFNIVVDVYTWVGSGNRTLAGFGLVLGSASVFDITHVVASFVFGLAFGSVLLRMLLRVRLRLQISWQPVNAMEHADSSGGARRPWISTGVVMVGISAVALSTGAPSDTARAASSRAKPEATVASVAKVDIARELTYLARAQNGDGGFGGAPGQSTSELYSGWVAMGLAAAGRPPTSLRKDGHSVLDALRGEASSLQGAGDLERTILALYACGVPVDSLDGRDPVSELLRERTADGSFDHQVNLTAFAIFALRATGRSSSDQVVAKAGRWIAKQQDADGGFGFGQRGEGSDVDDTAAALQGLIDAGIRSGSAVSRAVSFLVHAQNPDGGFPMEVGGESNAQSTAWAIQGLVAAGRNVQAIKRAGSRSPLGYLESLLAPNGSVRYSRISAQTPVWVTAQALTALAEVPFPVAPVGRSNAKVSTRVARTQAGVGLGKSSQGAAASRPAATSGVAHPSASRKSRGVGSSKRSSLTETEGRLNALAQSAGDLAGLLLAPMLG